MAGLSQGTLVLDREQARLANDPTAPPPGQLTFIKAGDPNNLLWRAFRPGTHVPIVIGKHVRRATHARVGDDGGRVLRESVPPSGAHKLAVRARCFLQGDSLYVAGVSGLGAALPSANYMGAMAAILASGATPATQALAVVTFNVVAFTVAEVPLVSYLAAPRKTRAFMAALQSWLRSRSRRDAALLVAAGGCLMLTLGLSNRFGRYCVDSTRYRTVPVRATQVALSFQSRDAASDRRDGSSPWATHIHQGRRP
ncbi:hypothetical protein W017_01947 [Mycobacterium tuberculosis TB_RSA107]|nr:hypothetical protein W017_01947 [Mycobacterium tuberculosis TB_RSA107]